MKIAIVGYGGKEGQSAYQYWQSDANQIEIRDQDSTLILPQGVQGRLGPEYLDDLEGFDLIVRTAGLNPNEIVKANSEAIRPKITTVVNEFFNVCPTKNVIGVTGTKGKGTTSTLIAKILEASGKRVHLGGNIGIATLELLKSGIQASDWVVLELSSFQLIDFKHAPHIGVCLMVVPEHLNWHLDFKDYLESKAQLFVRQQPSDIAIYFADNANSAKIASAGQGQKIPYFKPPGAYIDNDKVVIAGQTVCKTSEIKLIGQHNWQNVCAAITAVWQVTNDLEALRQVITNFSGLEHRLELVRQVKEVKYYNDSFASTPDAAIAAMDAITGMKVMILGGFDRHLPLEHLAKAVKEHTSDLRSVIIVGASAERLASEFNRAGFSQYQVIKDKTMPGIVQAASSTAQASDSVVLSPGFASFDMFKNFEERGQQFKAAVNNL